MSWPEVTFPPLFFLFFFFCLETSRVDGVFCVAWADVCSVRFFSSIDVLGFVSMCVRARMVVCFFSVCLHVNIWRPFGSTFVGSFQVFCCSHQMFRMSALSNALIFCALFVTGGAQDCILLQTSAGMDATLATNVGHATQPLASEGSSEAVEYTAEIPSQDNEALTDARNLQDQGTTRTRPQRIFQTWDRRRRGLKGSSKR